MKNRFAGFHVKPKFSMTSWQMVAANAAYVATSPGRRRAAWDRDHDAELRDIRGVAMAKGFDIEPRLVRRSS